MATLSRLLVPKNIKQIKTGEVTGIKANNIYTVTVDGSDINMQVVSNIYPKLGTLVNVLNTDLGWFIIGGIKVAEKTLTIIDITG
jgi:hypothetical protein